MDSATVRHDCRLALVLVQCRYLVVVVVQCKGLGAQVCSPDRPAGGQLFAVWWFVGLLFYCVWLLLLYVC